MQAPMVNQFPTSPWLLTTVLGVSAVDVLIAGFGSWCYGAVVMVAATLLAGVVRVFLPHRVSDLLTVRRCWMDITILFSLGTTIDVLALVVPPGT